jgi:hypothetical protein
MTYAVDVWYTSIHDEDEDGGRAKGSLRFVRRLEKIQWIATLSITGAMRTTAMDTLDLHAFLPPVRIMLGEG